MTTLPPHQATTTTIDPLKETKEEKTPSSMNDLDNKNAPSQAQPALVAQPEAAKKKPKRIIRRRRNNNNNQVDDASFIVDPVVLEQALQQSNLPRAYSFEIGKTVQRILQLNATHVALQMPEGLLLYATTLADVLQRLVMMTRRSSSTAGGERERGEGEGSSFQVSILGDVTYGACCVDDLGAQALGADLLVHYGHSCLVPLQHTAIPCLYIFVEIEMDVQHMIDCLDATLQQQHQQHQQHQQDDDLPHVYVLGTVQFRHSFAEALKSLQQRGYSFSIPQAKPLSPGEVLGCTTPRLVDHLSVDQTKKNHLDNKNNNKQNKAVVCFVADGRFHLESTLIANPHIDAFYRYDPYSRTLTTESYEHDKMFQLRHDAIQRASKATFKKAKATAEPAVFGIILGTLGRQGNPAVVGRIRDLLRKHGKRHFVVLLSEISPAKLQLFNNDNSNNNVDTVDVWVQVACPRLSVDWGHLLSDKPVLTPYELYVCLNETEWLVADNNNNNNNNDTNGGNNAPYYPMDYYSTAGGPWSNYFGDNKDRQLIDARTTTTPSPP